jgi:hypothetical protein
MRGGEIISLNRPFTRQHTTTTTLDNQITIALNCEQKPHSKMTAVGPLQPIHDLKQGLSTRPTIVQYKSL